MADALAALHASADRLRQLVPAADRALLDRLDALPPAARPASGDGRPLRAVFPGP